jgi:thioredoxin reductase (NADPH)
MAGVELRGENRVPVFDVNTMETNIPGLYLAGTVAAGIQQRFTIFIENAHEHAGKVTAAITGRWPERLGNASGRNFPLSSDVIEAN